MSLSTSKSKNQLAYAKTVKTNNKQKSKNNQGQDANEQFKSKQNMKNFTGNIYQSIMGQIDTTQQNYIKGLMVKNQRQYIKENNNNKKSKAQLNKPLLNLSQKQIKSSQSMRRITHQKTKSQAELLKNIVNQNQFVEKYQQLQNYDKNPILGSPKNSNHLNNNKNSTNSIVKIQSVPPYVINPIIDALQNSSSKFSRNIDSFQLEYPIENLDFRITHKKQNNKLTGSYFSCQASPKKLSKNSCIKQIILPLKSQVQILSNRKQKSQIPSTSTLNSNSHLKIKKNQQQQRSSISFIDSLDEYLMTLSKSQVNQMPTINMKKNNKKSQQYIANRLTVDHKQEQQQTVLYQQQLKSQKIEQKLQKKLQKQIRKVTQLKLILQSYQKQLTKYERKQNKMKDNQHHMIQCLKSLNQELNQQKNERKKVQNIVKDFQNRLRGISRSKNHHHDSKYHQFYKPQKTAYISQSHINYQQAYANRQSYKKYEKNTPKRLQKHSRRPSNVRYQSILINSAQSNLNEIKMPYKNMQIHSFQQNGRRSKSKNRQISSQKLNKNISAFDQDNYSRNNSKLSYLKQRKHRKEQMLKQERKKPYKSQIIESFTNNQEYNELKKKQQKHFNKSSDSENEKQKYYYRRSIQNLNRDQYDQERSSYLIDQSNLQQHSSDNQSQSQEQQKIVFRRKR